MRPRIALHLGLTLTLFAAPVSAQAPKPSRKLALLVGVQEYNHPNLKALRYAENDVTALAELLHKAGYHAVVLCEKTGKANPELMPTKANIEKQLALLLGQCKDRQDTVLLAFAGHGMQFDGQKDAFFCPRDAKPFADQSNTLVSLGLVYKDLERCFAGVKVLLVDACRNDPALGRGARSGIDGDSAPRPPRGVAVLFSCAAGEVAYEHEKFKHGVFFHFVLKGLDKGAMKADGSVTFHSLADYVADGVATTVPKLIGDGAQQSPNMKADIIGASPVILSVRAAPPTMQAVAQALVFVSDSARIESELDPARDKTLPGNKAYKEFTFEAQAGKTYRIEFAGKGFKPYLYLQDSSNSTVMENANSAGAADSQIVCKAEKTGTYRIVATSVKGGTGTFTLSVRRVELAPAKVQQFVIKNQPTQVSGELTAKDAVDAQGKHFRSFTFEGEAGKLYRFDMVGGAGLEPFVRIEDSAGKAIKQEDLFENNKISRLTFNAPQSGTYRAVATAYKPGMTGTFTLTAVRLDPRIAKVLTLNLAGGQATVNGTIDMQDGLDSQGKYHKVYAFKAEAGKGLRFDMTGHNGLDPYVRITDGSGFSLQEEQFSEGNKLSRLVFVAKQPGTYRAVVTTFRAGAIGTYTLNVVPDTGKLTAPVSAPFALANGQASVYSSITAQDPVDSNGCYFKAFPFAAAKGKTYRFELKAKNGLDPSLRIETAQGQVVQNEDFGDGKVSRVFFKPVMSGTYRAVATTFNKGATGSFTLTAVVELNYVPPPPKVVAKGQSVPFKLDNGQSRVDGELTDEDSFDGANRYYLGYAFKAEAGRTYRFEMVGKNNLDPVLRIETIGGQILKKEDFGDGKVSRLAFTPSQAGTYIVITTTYKGGMTGGYTLTATQDVGAGTTPTVPPKTVPTKAVPFKLANGLSAFTGSLTDKDLSDNKGKYYRRYEFYGEAGKTYRFEMVGKEGINPLLQIDDSQGKLAKNEDFGDGKVSRVTFTPTQSGTFYLVATTLEARMLGEFSVTAARLENTNGK